MKIATNTHAGPMLPRAAAEDHPILQRHRLGALELLPWIAALAVFYLAPGYLALGTQVLIMLLFALSLDLLLGYAGGFVGSHLLAREIGAWPSVLTVAGAVGAAAWVASDRRA